MAAESSSRIISSSHQTALKTREAQASNTATAMVQATPEPTTKDFNENLFKM
jgi:hypothetical protein